MPKVSIVVPVYNVEKYLDRCVSSLVNQTLRDIEIILVDDGSPDSSPKLCDEWAVRDSRIRVIHKKNEGLGLTRNAGLLAAKGKYVSFVDSDDYVSEDMMQRLYEECISNILDCVYSEFNIDEYPGFRVIKRPEKLYDGYNEIEELRLDIVGAEPTYISGVKYHCSSCKGLYSLDLIMKHDIRFFSERQFISEDILFNLDFLYYARRVKIVPWQFYHYCLNNDSLTHTYRPDRWKKLVLMLHKLNDREKFNNKEELSLRLNRTAIFYTMTAIQLERQRKDANKIIKMKAIKEVERTTEIKEALKDYPVFKLPVKWTIYSLLLKYKLLEYAYFFVL